MNKTDDMINKHIAAVQLRMERLAIELSDRSQKHDESKLENPEHSMWLCMDKDSLKPKYGTPEYFQKMKKFKYVFDQHYKDPRNRHHPEHWENGIYDMNLIDITEMLCDWISYKSNLSYSEASKVIEENCKRFGFDEQIRNILLNTLREYFSSFGGEDDNNYIKVLKDRFKLKANC